MDLTVVGILIIIYFVIGIFIAYVGDSLSRGDGFIFPLIVTLVVILMWPLVFILAFKKTKEDKEKKEEDGKE